MEAWVEQAARLTKPDKVVFCDGSAAENETILNEMLSKPDSLRLNPKTYPNCQLHRSDPSDVARTEHLTFICTPRKEDVGPTNNWMDPDGAKYKVGSLLDGAMRGRTMYVVPYIMGPVSSPISKVGVKVTYMAAAFPSACGKTNLAMMVSALQSQGYKVWTVGDDIAWMRIGEDGYL